MISPAWAQTATGGGTGGSMITTFLPLVLIFAVFYLLLIRPQQKKQKAHQQKLQGIHVGDHIMTGGGIYARVVQIISDHELKVRIADGVEIRVARAMVVDVIEQAGSAKAFPDEGTAAKKPKKSTRSTKTAKSAGTAARKTTRKPTRSRSKSSAKAASEADSGGSDTAQ